MELTDLAVGRSILARGSGLPRGLGRSTCVKLEVVWHDSSQNNEGQNGRKVRPATTQFHKELILYSAEEFEL